MGSIRGHSAGVPVKSQTHTSKVSVLFVSGEPDTAGHRYRIADFAAALPSDQYDVIVLRQGDIARTLNQLADFRVVWFWRARLTPAVARLLKWSIDRGSVVVGDIDDLVFASSSVTVDDIDGFRAMGWNPSSAGPLFSARSAVLAAADLRTATTKPLVEALEMDIGPAVALPNGYDETSWNISNLARRLRPPSGLFRIGYAGGTRTHQRDLQVAAPAIAQFLTDNQDARLVLFEGCVNLLEFPELMAHVDQVEWRARVPISAMPFEYARFDVSIAPLEPANRFCDAKSALKFFEAALVDVVSVASPTPPFRELIQDGNNGFLAESQLDWYQAFAALFRDAERRHSLANQARQDAIWNCGPLRQGRMVSDVIAAVLRGETQPLDPAQSWPLRTFPAVSTATVNVVADYCRPVIAGGSVALRVTSSTADVVSILESIANQDRDDLDLIVVAEGADTEVVNQVSTWLLSNRRRFARVRLGTLMGSCSETVAANCMFALAMSLYLVWLAPDAGPLDPRAITQALAEARRRKVGRVPLASGASAQTQSVVYSVEAWAAVGGLDEAAPTFSDALDSLGVGGLNVF